MDSKVIFNNITTRPFSSNNSAGDFKVPGHFKHKSVSYGYDQNLIEHSLLTNIQQNIEKDYTICYLECFNL